VVRRDVVAIVPAYNEEETIAEVVGRTSRHAEVCVVDDASTDRTPEILAALEGVHVVRHAKNTHIAGAVLDGMRYALEAGYPRAVTLDAGLSHDPDQIPRFLEAGAADLLIGTRTVKHDTPLYRRALSVAGNLVYNASLDFPRSMIAGRYYRDITSGFRLYSARAMRALVTHSMRSRSFDFLFESAMVVYRAGLAIDEVPITYRFSNSSLKARVVRDCLRRCWHGIKDRRSPRPRRRPKARS
jgi:dolichol-phosphate mannosyltransferase